MVENTISFRRLLWARCGKFSIDFSQEIKTMKITTMLTTAILTITLGCDGDPPDSPTCSAWLSCYEECLVVPHPGNTLDYITMPIEASIVQCAAVCGEETEWKYRSWDPAAAPCPMNPDGLIEPIEQLVAACDVDFNRD